ncbi:unnamed protein product, partial [Clonostachys byssicola]
SGICLHIAFQNISQRNEQSGIKHDRETDGVRRCDVSPWTFEITALATTAGQFFAMIAVLVYFNGREAIISSFITPNTVVSILSTGCKASLISAASSCISQATWVLFADRPRRLFDFEMVADASRGELGSIRLVFSKRFQGGLLVRLGALRTIFTIAMDPFAQQLVKITKITRLAAWREHISIFAMFSSYSKVLS